MVIPTIAFHQVQLAAIEAGSLEHWRNLTQLSRFSQVAKADQSQPFLTRQFVNVRHRYTANAMIW